MILVEITLNIVYWSNTEQQCLWESIDNDDVYMYWLVQRKWNIIFYACIFLETHPEFTKCSVYVDSGCCLDFLWRCCDTLYTYSIVDCIIKKVKVAHTRLPSVRFWSWSLFLAVSLQVTWVISPAVDCHYFPPGLQLPSQPLRGLLPVRTMGVNSLPKTVTRQRRGCDLNPGPYAPESSTLTTRLPSHPGWHHNGHHVAHAMAV